MEIVRATKETVLKTQERFIDVEATITVGGEVETVKRGYPVETTATEIRADLEAYEALRNTEVEREAEQAAQEAQEAVVDATVADLTGN